MLKRYTKIALIAAACALAWVHTGCASTYSKGFEIVKAKPQNYTASYNVNECKSLQAGEVQAVGNIEYFLDDSGQKIMLYEFAQGSGARFANHWVEGEDDVFFGYVRLINRGFKFVIPKDRSKPGTRYVYVVGQFRAVDEGGVMKVQGDHVFECAMIPGGENPSLGATETISSTALSPGYAKLCESDKECPGDEICEGGLCVLQAKEGEVTQCNADKDCPGEEICEKKICVAPSGEKEMPAEPEPLCRSDKECKGERVCLDGKCDYPKTEDDAIGQECSVDVDCPGKLICVDRKCSKPKKKR